jgi:hypothetical protein
LHGFYVPANEERQMLNVQTLFKMGAHSRTSTYKHAVFTLAGAAYFVTQSVAKKTFYLQYIFGI